MSRDNRTHHWLDARHLQKCMVNIILLLVCTATELRFRFSRNGHILPDQYFKETAINERVTAMGGSSCMQIYTWLNFLDSFLSFLNEKIKY